MPVLSFLTFRDNTFNTLYDSKRERQYIFFHFLYKAHLICMQCILFRFWLATNASGESPEVTLETKVSKIVLTESLFLT